MKLSASLFLAAIPSLGVWAVPTTHGANSLSNRAPEEDWKTPLGWDGKITPMEEVGSWVDLKERATDDSARVVKRFLGGFYLCKDYQFTGGCIYIVFPTSGHCGKWDEPWRTTVSSVGPDPGTTCYLYMSSDCTWGDSTLLSHPGGDLRGDANGISNYWSRWDNNIGSVKCFF